MTTVLSGQKCLVSCSQRNHPLLSLHQLTPELSRANNCPSESIRPSLDVTQRSGDLCFLINVRRARERVLQEALDSCKRLPKSI